MHKPASAYPDEFLGQMRQKADPVADGFVRSCFTDASSKLALFDSLKRLNSNAALEEAAPELKTSEVFAECQTLPFWASRDLMAAGSAFFTRHAEVVMQLLGILSLPYCYAAADGARVLAITNRLRGDINKRLTDTGQFIWDVMSPLAFHAEGAGFAACLKVRLTHAAARYYVLKVGDWNPVWGMPANQEDVAGTNLAFSLIVIRGLRKLGYSVSHQDQVAFMHLWAVIAKLLGLEDSLIPRDGKAANLLEKRIRERQFRMSEEGVELSAALLEHFRSVLKPPATIQQILSIMRFLLGDEISDMLNIPASALPFYLPPVLQISAGIQKIRHSNSVHQQFAEKYRNYKAGLGASA